MNAISEATERVGISARAAETDMITRESEEHKIVGGSRTQQQFVNRAQATVDLAAENLSDFATTMSPHVEQFKTQNRVLFDNLRCAFRRRCSTRP